MPPANQPQSNELLDAWGRRNRKHADKNCAHCGASFQPRKASSNYCSRPCARTKNGGRNKKPEVWWVNGRGYLEGRVRTPEGERRMKHHRLVMERHVGRQLLPTEDVHHIDGNKLNNAIENLQLISHAEHTKITNAERTPKRGHKLNLTDAQRAERSAWMKARHAKARKARAALSAVSPEKE